MLLLFKNNQFRLVQLVFKILFVGLTLKGGDRRLRTFSAHKHWWRRRK